MTEEPVMTEPDMVWLLVVTLPAVATLTGPTGPRAFAILQTDEDAMQASPGRFEKLENPLLAFTLPTTSRWASEELASPAQDSFKALTPLLPAARTSTIELR